MLLSVILWEMYSKNASEGKGVGKPNYALIESILEGIKKWGTKKMPSSMISSIGLNPSNVEEYRPVLPQGQILNTPISVRMQKDINDDLWEIKFGNFTEKDEKDIYKLDPNDDQRLNKAVWVDDLVQNEIVNDMIQNNKKGLKFKPYSDDGFEDYRLGLFKKIYNKLDKTKFQWNNLPNNWYSITKI